MIRTVLCLLCACSAIQSAHAQPAVVQPSAGQSWPRWGVGAATGWRAPFGHTVSAHYFPWDLSDVHANFGVNDTGIKAGLGVSYVAWFNALFDANLVADYLYARSSYGKTTLDAEFIPEGGASSEGIKATKNYNLDACHALNLGAGFNFRMWKIRAGVVAGYTIPLFGNDVRFSEDTQFNQRVVLLNERTFNEEFQAEGRKTLKVGGFSAQVQVQYLLFE